MGARLCGECQRANPPILWEGLQLRRLAQVGTKRRREYPEFQASEGPRLQDTLRSLPQKDSPSYEGSIDALRIGIQLCLLNSPLFMQISSNGYVMTTGTIGTDHVHRCQSCGRVQDFVLEHIQSDLAAHARPSKLNRSRRL